MFKLRSVLSGALLWGALHCQAMAAPVLYQSGAYSGGVDGGNNVGDAGVLVFSVSNPFTPVADGVAGSIQLAVQTLNNRPEGTVEWIISSAINGGGTLYASGISPMINLVQSSGPSVSQYLSTFSIG